MMMKPNLKISVTATLLIGLAWVSGCGQPADDAAQTSAPESAPPAAATEPAEPSGISGSMPDVSEPAAPAVSFAPLSIDGSSSAANQNSNAASVSAEARHRSIMEKLKPLQGLLGQWRGTTRKEYDGSKAVDSHEWVWDLKTNPAQPALAVKSDRSPYVRQARLTWDPAGNCFQLICTDQASVERTYTGDFTDPVHEIVGPDDKLHKVFRIAFTQTPESAEQSGGESWQLALTRQENDRYLLEVEKRRGTAPFRRYDTVSTQRDGTSFAANDSDYGEKECIISQGLGTIAVSYQGKSYWVCCSGCKAAFEEDPETWIARAEQRAQEKK
ncbi:MAG: hypothetical protein R3C49_06045 [Planctomycetaceae bacterium]